MSEGEEFISDFLEFENISFESEVKIYNLEGDTKSHRRVDFYLPKYRVYIEFLGQWNIDSHKERYREKKSVFKKNSIPCIYLYPENLGIIEYIFHKRLITELISYKLKKELLRYRIIELWKENSENFLYLLLGVIMLVYNYPWFQEQKQLWSIIGLVLILYQFNKIRNTIRQIFQNKPIQRRFFN